MRRAILSEWVRAKGSDFPQYLPQLVGGLKIPLETALDYCGVLPVRRDAGDSWQINENGELALIVAVHWRTDLVDLLAVLGGAPNDWLLARNVAPLLGHDNADMPLAADEPLRIRVSPLSWLRDGARGACILDWKRARWFLPSHRKLAAENETHAAGLYQRLMSVPDIVVAANG